MFEHLRTYVARPTVFLAAGIAIGALLAPAFGGSGAQGVTTYTRAVSCQGLNWQPLTGTIVYGAAGMRRTNETTAAYFICNPNLPHKAVVTRVRFTLYDATGNGSIGNCALVRAGLSPTTAATYQVMASVPVTSTSPDIQRLQDTTIDFATIDNMNFGYFLQCQDPGAGSTYLGIYGADITYKITAANG
jgi:hypothetical protein